MTLTRKSISHKSRGLGLIALGVLSTGVPCGILLGNAASRPRAAVPDPLQEIRKSLLKTRVPAELAVGAPVSTRVVYVGVELPRCSSDRFLAYTAVDPKRHVTILLPGVAPSDAVLLGPTAEGISLVADKDRRMLSEMIYINAPIVFLVDPLGTIIDVQRAPAVTTAEDLARSLVK